MPIDDHDSISIPPLQNFVMNRLAGDVFEKLLYARARVRVCARILCALRPGPPAQKYNEEYNWCLCAYQRTVCARECAYARRFDR